VTAETSLRKFLARYVTAGDEVTETKYLSLR
jgi:hypothetical protein